ncbi:hypothetical protein EWI07_00940 [Sporolactobacillus sp. THM7-4]|nr:hypothetical protein EWI07_00940 [Sporolactobacillus sp. THM7-4]
MEMAHYPNKPVNVNPYAQNPVMQPKANLPVQAPVAPVKKQKGKKGMPGNPMMAGIKPCPDQALHCPPRNAGSMYDPELINVEHVYKPVIMQHIHPMRTVIKTHYVYEHQHYYPHEVSETCDECHFDVQCGYPCFPEPHC